MKETIKHKNSTVSGKKPTSSDLVSGELALNSKDGKIFTKKDNGEIVEFRPNGKDFDLINTDTALSNDEFGSAIKFTTSDTDGVKVAAAITTIGQGSLGYVKTAFRRSNEPNVLKSAMEIEPDGDIFIYKDDGNTPGLHWDAVAGMLAIGDPVIIDDVTLFGSFDKVGQTNINSSVNFIGVFTTYGGFLQYKKDNSTSFPALTDASNGKWVPAGQITANHYGFFPGASGSSNKSAVKNALAFAQGSEVLVYVESDFNLGTIDLIDAHMNLRFIGAGEEISLSQVIDWRTFSTDIYDITEDIAAVNITLRGQSGNKVHRLRIANTSNYSIHDTVRVVTDIEDVTVGKPDRRLGEAAQVVQTDSNYLYVTPLEDVDTYNTNRSANNVRVGKIQPYKCSVKNLRIKTNITRTNELVTLRNCLDPDIDVSWDYHGKTCLKIEGAVGGKVKTRGNGTTNSANELGYGVNYASCTDTKFEVYGDGFRHLITSNWQEVPPNSTEFHRYGPCRRCHISGETRQAWGSPFDDHGGSRGTVYENCIAKGSMSNFDSPFGFNLRGNDAHIVNCFVDHSYDGFLRVSDATIGTITVTNSVTHCKIIHSDCTDAGAYPIVLWNGGKAKINNSFTTLNAQGCDIHLSNIFINFTCRTTSSFDRIFIVTGGRLFLDNVSIDMNWINTNDNHEIVRIDGFNNKEVCTGKVIISQNRDGLAFCSRLEGVHANGLSLKVISKNDFVPSLMSGGAPKTNARVAVVSLSNPSANINNIADFNDYMNFIGIV